MTATLPNVVKWAQGNGINFLNPSQIDEDDCKFLMVDVETTGLDPRTDVILEMGAVLTDAEGYCIAEPVHFYPRLGGDLGERTSTALDNMPEVVRAMHAGSGLWDDRANNRQETFESIAADLENYVGCYTGNPKAVRMAGSTIKFDYYMLWEFMRPWVETLHHRAIDVSTLKELCVEFNPKLAEQLKRDVPKQGLHRVLPDLVDTINEYAFYVDNLIYWGDR